MPGWKDKLKGDPVTWLLESDETRPAIRYYALRDILGRDENDKEVKAAKAAIMASGPVPVILAAQQPEGYWDKPGANYGPKYAGCKILLSQCIASNGGLSWNGTPSGFEQCMAGRMGAALIDFGWLNDQRLQTAMEWLAQTITGEGVADASNRNTNKRYYKSKNSAPGFVCALNGNLPCAWGAIKAMVALSKVPAEERTRNMQVAIEQGVSFLLSRDPAVADYPFGMGNKPNSSWFKFGYPIGYITDVLENLEVLAALGQAKNPKLANALDLVTSVVSHKQPYNGQVCRG
jgi:hypothetical protein